MLYRIDTAVPTTQALCVTPTRELAIQILEKAVRPMSANMLLPVPLRVQLAVSQSEKPGSHSSSPGANSSGSSSSVVPHLVVGTPGKIVDWLKRKIISAAFVKVFVLDEADTMVAAGSGHRANSLLIKKQLPSENSCQCLFFSATFSEPVVQFASKMMQNSADKILIADGPEFLVRGMLSSYE